MQKIFAQFFVGSTDRQINQIVTKKVKKDVAVGAASKKCRTWQLLRKAFVLLFAFVLRHMAKTGQ